MSSRKTVLELFHDDMGHRGRDKTLSLIQDIFIWHGMTAETENYIKTCERCILRKSDKDRAPLTPIQTFNHWNLGFFFGFFF